MSEQVAVVIPASLEMAQAFQKIFPNAQIRKIRHKEKEAQAEPQQQEEPVKASTPADREKLLRDIICYCQERGGKVDGVRFFNYYDSRDWIDASGKKIADWKSKVAEWEGNGIQSKPKKFKSAYEAEITRDPTFGGKLEQMLEDLNKI